MRVNRVLLIRPSALGDVVRSVPVLASLRRAFPAAPIDWLVQDSFADAVRAHPALTANGGGVVAFPRKRFARWYMPRVGLELAGWLSGLRRTGYDLVIDAQGLLRSGLFAAASGARVRVGYANAKESGWIGYTHKVAAPTSWHAVDRMLELVKAVGVEPVRDLRLYVPDADLLAAGGLLAGCGRLAVLAPTTRWPSKQWMPERFAELGRWLLGPGRFDQVVLVGGRGEEGQCLPLLEWARGESRVVNLIGRTTVGQLMGVIRRGDLLVGSDSAAVHMAAGLDRPCVALYGPTDVAKVGPARGMGVGERVVVVQRIGAGETLDHKALEPGRTQMSRITTGDVIDAACCATR